MVLRARLYFVRHAETIANRDNILQGHSDYPLTPEGEAQSQALGEVLKDKVWDAVFASDLQRVLTSSAFILSKSNVEGYYSQLVKTELLREVNFGAREGLSRFISVKEARQIRAAEANIPIDEFLDSAETSAQLHLRQKQLMSFLYDNVLAAQQADLTDDSKLFTALCVSHGGFIKRFITDVCHSSVAEKIDNCSVSIVNVSWDSATKYRCTVDRNEVNINFSSTYIP